MPTTPHLEQHFQGSERIRDVVIGLADGLTVPFALAAGLSAAVQSSKLVVTAGMAEVAAGAIAMGLGGYLAARGDAEHYASEEARERREIVQLRDREVAEVADILRSYGLAGGTLEAAVERLTADPDRWTAFMMRFELGLEKPDPKRAPTSAATIAVAYVCGGLVPLAPYFVVGDVHSALPASIGLTGVALAAFGAIKGHLTGSPILRSAIQTFVVGGLAAGAAFWLASLFG